MSRGKTYPSNMPSLIAPISQITSTSLILKTDENKPLWTDTLSQGYKVESTLEV